MEDVSKTESNGQTPKKTEPTPEKGALSLFKGIKNNKIILDNLKPLYIFRAIRRSLYDRL